MPLRPPGQRPARASRSHWRSSDAVGLQTLRDRRHVISPCLDDELPHPRARRRLEGPLVLSEHPDPETVTDVSRVEASKAVVHLVLAVGPRVERMPNGLPAIPILHL